VVFFCPFCFAEIDRAAKLCPRCGVDPAEFDALPFSQKLRLALNHPEPETAARAGWILGERGEHEAVVDLIRVLKTTPDSYLAENAAVALGKLGDSRAVPNLRRAASRGTLRVRHAAAAALAGVFRNQPERARFERRG
jgi:HEAT repeat protein